MALAIAVCIAGFVTIYVQLQPFISDFVTQDPPEEEARVVAPVATQRPATTADEEPEPTAEPVDEEVEQAPAETAVDVPEPTEASDGFNPDLQSNSDFQINLRSQPNTSSQVLIVLTFAQPLQGTGESAPSANPAAEGDTWIEVETEDGEIGWIRQIDSEPFEE